MPPFDGTQSYKQLAKWMERLRDLKHDSMIKNRELEGELRRFLDAEGGRDEGSV
jgi:hypothetical protein